jgi:type I restriction enzyme S subunit
VPSNPIDLKFAYYLLLNARLRQLDQSTAVPSLSRDIYGGVSVRIPPAAEQRRIAAKIEELFGEIEAGEQELEKAREGLEAYRRAVLKAAVTGELTREWREKNTPNETGADLLNRILAERRAAWRRAELAKMKAKGEKTKNDNFKFRYSEPASATTSELPSLPDGWTWTTIDQLTRGDRSCAYGVLQPGPDVANGVPLVRVGDIKDGRVDLRNLKKIAQEIDADYQRTRLRGGELLMTLVGAIGRTAIAPNELAGANTARAVGVIPISDLIYAAWVEFWFRSPAKSNEMVGKAHEVARKTLNLEDVRAATVALPPFLEQAKLVDEIEFHLSLVEEVGGQLEAQQQAAQALRQSILAAAFSGKLVPQNSADEPATALLERLRAQKAAAPARSARAMPRAPRRRGASGDPVASA